jgi:ribonuclease P protein subunit RPR2
LKTKAVVSNKNIIEQKTLTVSQSCGKNAARSEGETLEMNPTTKQIAKRRIQVLFQQAEKTRRENPQLAGRYIETARKIAMAAKIRLPTQYKRRICKNCNTLLVLGDNCRVRIKQKRETHLVITCLTCGHQTRMLLRKKKEKTKLEQNNHSNETSR